MSGYIGGSWYALYVRSRREKNVHTLLEAKQHEAFLPLFHSRHKWADRWKTVSLPLFPGYVFCRFEPESRPCVLATSGIIDVVRLGSEPAPIDPTEMLAIQRIASSPLMTEPYAGLIKGCQVSMRGGPLSGVTGTLLEVQKRCRLVVSIELLGRSVLVEIDRDWAVPTQNHAMLSPAWTQDRMEFRG
jgi:transcription antitermination factor NusG